MRGWRPTVLAIWRTASKSPGLVAREPRFHHVDAQARQLLRNIQFSWVFKVAPGSLTIAEGRIKNDDPLTVGNGGVFGDVGDNKLVGIHMGQIYLYVGRCALYPIVIVFSAVSRVLLA